MSDLKTKATKQDDQDRLADAVEQETAGDNVEIVEREGGTWSRVRLPNGLTNETRIA